MRRGTMQSREIWRGPASSLAIGAVLGACAPPPAPAPAEVRGSTARDTAPEAPTAPAPSASASTPAAAGSASTTASSADGEVAIQGLDGYARHTHGGAPARLGWARFRVENRGRKPRAIRAEAVDYLHGHSCEVAPAEVRASPKPTGLLAEDGVQKESAPSITLAPGAALEIIVGFAPAVDAYYVFCDRFAFRVRFGVDGAPLAVVAETHVARVEPPRPRAP
jgi:hypothetical protein